MERINRNIAPEVREIKDVQIENPEIMTLSNGAEVFVFDSGTQEIVRIEIMLKAGAKYHSNKRLPIVANKLLISGTKKMSGDDIAAMLDYYGAGLSTKVTNDYAFISLTVLNKHLADTLPVMADILENADFPQKELDLYLTKKAQELAINNQRTGFVARDRFPALLFGEDNAYGRPSYIEDYRSVTVEALKDFHGKYYKNNAFEIHISGMVPRDLIGMLDDYFGKLPYKEVETVKLDKFTVASDKHNEIEFPQAVQNSLRLGKRWVSRKHPDYAGLQVLITLFGGYFGSRLMKNIREDKGYTYGIGAGVSQFQDASFMFITSDVKSEATGDALKEIYNEMQKLKDEEISPEELLTVKTVMQGAFQRGFDGPFARADRYKEMRMAGLDFEFYRSYLNDLKVVTSGELMNLASEYLNFDDIYELIVGNFNLNI